jgi:hypothetical protein
LRHTFARQMTENGGERTALCDLMRHASISSTNGYGNLSEPCVKQSYFKTHGTDYGTKPISSSAGSKDTSESIMVKGYVRRVYIRGGI